MFSSLAPRGDDSGSSGGNALSPAGDIVDLFTLLRPAGASSDGAPSLPSGSPSDPGNPPAVAALLSLLDRHRVLAAAALNVSALQHDAALGNQETLQLCAGHPRLYPAFVLDPRQPGRAAKLPETRGARLLCLLPATQRYPIAFAPIRRLLRQLGQQGGNNGATPLLIEAGRPGDATALASLLSETGYAGPIILSNVCSDTGATLAEALAVAEDMPGLLVATDGLRGVGEVGAAVATLGAERIVFASGAPDSSLGASLALVRHARLSLADQNLILGGNARRLLGDPMQSAAALIDGPGSGRPGDND